MNQEWKNISDDDLDRLFREAADEKNVGFEADSWKKMNQKLDALPKTEEKSYWKRAIPLLLLLLIGSVGGYFLLKPSAEKVEIVENNAIENKILEENNNTKTEANSSKIQGKENEDLKVSEETKELILSEKSESVLDEKSSVNDLKSSNYKKNESEKINNLETKNIKISKSEERKVEEKNNISSNTLNKNNSTLSNEKSSKKTILKKQKRNNFTENDFPKTASNFSEKQNTNFLKSEISESGKSNQGFEEKTISNSNQKTENTTQNTENQTVIHNSTTLSTNIDETENLKKWELWGINENLKNKNVSFRTDWNLPKIEFQALLPTKIQTNPQGIPFKRGLNLRLSLSPDLSTVSFNKIEKIGVNYGGMIEYRFNKRWSLQTGLFRSTKIYDAYPEQYTWTWKKAYTPLTEINATCKMLDVPINLRFDLTKKAKNRWFVSAGATTYHMLNETYVYNYENEFDPSIKIRKWVGSTGTYGLKVLNFSTGYEWQIKRKMTLQLEPFAKIPTQKIGFGKVNLMTFGVFFSGKYHLGK